MNKLHLGTAIAFLCLVNNVQADQAFYEDQGACPFECCTYREWTATERTVVHEARDRNSPTAFVLEPEEHVVGVTGVVITLEPGKTIVNLPYLVECGREKFMAAPGDSFELLHYEGEGFFKFKFQGRVCSAEVPWPVKSEKEHGVLHDGRAVKEILTTESVPKTVWWVMVKNAIGKQGWSDEPGHFAHMDACE